MKVFVSTHPFASTSTLPRDLLADNGIELIVNAHGRKISSRELALEIKDAQALIAGTEIIDENVLRNAQGLKLIARVGVGLDGVDFDLCEKYGIKVTYTPEAPTLAVAELCVGLMLDLSRKISETDRRMRSGVWHRHMGGLLRDKTIGIFGKGRIGKSLIHLLSSFNVKFLVHDVRPDLIFGSLYNVKFVSKEQLLRESDIISVNLPLKKDTRDFISYPDFCLMKKTALLINTARGGVINENDLCKALKEELISGAAIDVFEEEPYRGELCELPNCILTCHMGASTQESRTDMELQAAEEVVRYFKGQELRNEVFSNA